MPADHVTDAKQAAGSFVLRIINLVHYIPTAVDAPPILGARRGTGGRTYDRSHNRTGAPGAVSPDAARAVQRRPRLDVHVRSKYCKPVRRPDADSSPNAEICDGVYPGAKQTRVAE